jgi:hypothetical protein
MHAVPNLMTFTIHSQKMAHKDGTTLDAFPFTFT